MGDKTPGGDVAVIDVLDLETDFRYTPISISLRGSSKKDPIPVEHYSLTKPPLPFIDLDHYDDDDLQIISAATTHRHRHPLRKKPFRYPSITEPGESSSSSSCPKPTTIEVVDDEEEDEPLICQICFDPTPKPDIFTTKACDHPYCNDCMSRHVAAKIQENLTSIHCPAEGCSVVLQPEFCQSILPEEVFHRWGSALCENLILGAQKFYCPFKDCSALLIDDGGEAVVECECPHCRRLFCAQCKVPWHVGIECGEFQKLSMGEREREDIMLMKLAKDKKWQRCPKCKFYVERSDGCLYMRCRCGYSFCYNCAAQMSGNNHNCTKCLRF